MYILQHIFSTHLSIGGHLGCFDILAIVNSALNMRVLICPQDPDFFYSGEIPKSGITGSFGSYFSSLIFFFFEEPPFCSP